MFGENLYRQKTGGSIRQKYALPFACLVSMAGGELEEDWIFPSEKFQVFVLNDLESEDEKDNSILLHPLWYTGILLTWGRY